MVCQVIRFFIIIKQKFFQSHYYSAEYLVAFSITSDMANGHEFTVDCNGQIQFATQYTNETLWLLEETCGSDANIATQNSTNQS